MSMQIPGSGLNLYSIYKTHNYYYSLSSIPKQGLSSFPMPYPFSNYQDSLRTKFTTALRETRDLAISLESSSKALTTSARGDVFEKRIVNPSDNNLVKGTALDNATEAEYSINISQLATAQKNIGNDLASGGASNVAVGTNLFKITNGAKSYNLSIELRIGDTNKNILEKMAQVINNSEAGVTAKVISDSTSNSSRIEIVGKTTGLGNEFSIQDTGGGSLIAETGAATIAAHTQDAVYKLNNEEKTSKSNRIALDNGKIALELLGNTSNPINIKVGKNEKEIHHAITAFVGDYNKMVKSLQGNQGIISSSILRDLTGYSSTNRYNLQEVEITVNADKTLKINSDKLTLAIKDNVSSVQGLLGSSGGLVSKVNNKVSNLVQSPLSGLVNHQQQGQLQRYNSWNQFSDYLLAAYGAGSFYDSLI